MFLRIKRFHVQLLIVIFGGFFSLSVLAFSEALALTFKSDGSIVQKDGSVVQPPKAKSGPETKKRRKMPRYKVSKQKDPGGLKSAYSYSVEIPERGRPNDATISLYEKRRLEFIESRMSKDRMYVVPPSDNAEDFVEDNRLQSLSLDKELSEGFILSYLFYDQGVVKYNGTAAAGRFERDIDDQTLFFTHSTGKSIVSYIVGHAICAGYVESIDEIIDWPMMANTLYQGQSLRDLLDMMAGDTHLLNKSTTYIRNVGKHHRDMGLDEIAIHLAGSKKQERKLVYNNFLSDVIANYVAYKSGENYDQLMRDVFQNKIKIKHAVMYEKHKSTTIDGVKSKYFGTPQTTASYSFFMTRFDFLRLGLAIMRDYQNETCVGKYLKNIQSQAKPFYKYKPSDKRAHLWLNRYAKKYGGQFYFDFHNMKNRNIFGTEGKNGQNIMIDMDNSRVWVINSAATGYDVRHFLLNAVREGDIPG